MSAADVALSPARDGSTGFPGYCRTSRNCRNSCDSILVYLTAVGSVTSVIIMRILELDSIASVKLRIQTCKGFVVKKQKLVYGGRELARQDSLVKDYGVTSGNVLHLVVKPSDILVISVRTVSGKEFEFHVRRHRNVAYLKHRIAKKGKGFVDLESQELFCNGEKLEDEKLINDISNNKDAVIHLLVQESAKVKPKPIEKDFELSVEAAKPNVTTTDGDKSSVEVAVVAGEPPRLGRNFSLDPIIGNPRVTLSLVIGNMIEATSDGLKSGNSPIRSSEGTGGAYFMPDSSGDKLVSVFKPIDEEPNAVNNPQGLPVSSDGEGLKRGTRVGEGALREVAAYILDHPRSGPRILTGEVMGFAGVPPTVMVQCLHEGFNHPDGYEGTAKNIKTGSLQMFMDNNGSCEDMGPRAFPVEEVHKISVLDIRMANADRHSGNILISKDEEGQTVLIPIDHGYCLPESFEDCTFDWLYWPQAHQPYSADTVNYIKSLNAEEDIKLLKFYGWDISPKCARTLRISTMLLKKGVKRGLTPFAIGNIMCRETVNKVSVIEEMVHEAEDCLLPGMSEAAFLEALSLIMDRWLDGLVK